MGEKMWSLKLSQRDLQNVGKGKSRDLFKS